MGEPRLRFGDWILDLPARRLTRCGASVHLPRRTFELLALLVEERPRVVPRCELLRRLWPSVFVCEGTLTALAGELRRALRDDARRPRLLRTVHGTGYAFCGEALPPEPAPPASAGFRLMGLGREVVLCEGETVLGRAPAATLCVPSITVSRRHARIVVAGGAATLEDLGSRNGTYLRGGRVLAPAALADGDTIALGSVSFVLRAGLADRTTAAFETGAASDH